MQTEKQTRIPIIAIVAHIVTQVSCRHLRDTNIANLMLRQEHMEQECCPGRSNPPPTKISESTFRPSLEKYPVYYKQSKIKNSDHRS